MNSRKNWFLGIAVFCLFCFPVASFAQAVQYMYGTVPQGKEEPKPVTTLIAAKAQVVTGYPWSKGFLFGKKTFKTYILTVPNESVDEFAATGLFKKLPEGTTISLVWSRVSDINGWGTEVNGEVHRRVNYNFDMKEAEFADGFKLVTGAISNYLEKLQEIDEEKYGYLMEKAPVTAFERGFVVSFNLSVYFPDVTDGGKRVDLFSFSRTSGYYR